VAAPSLAQTPVLQPGQAIVEAGLPGVVRGIVVHGESDEPVGGVMLVLRRPRTATTRRFPDPWVTDVGGDGPVARVETDAQGRFSFEGLEPSRYSVSTRRSGLGGETGHLWITTEQPTADVILRIDLGGVIRGIVVDVDGRPMNRVSVLLSGLDLGDGLNRLGRARPDRVITARDGTFVLLGAPRGTVYIQSARRNWGWSEPLAVPMRDVRWVDGLRIVLLEEPGVLAFHGPGGVGVGLDFSPAGPVINRVYDDSPAQRAGLQPHDLISRVAGRATRFMTSREFRARCRGLADTRVELTVVRPDGTRRDVSMRRSTDPWGERPR
jgi:hypothetical protein